MRNGCVFIISIFITAHSHLYVGSGGLWQLLVEPWRVVEGTAGAGRSHTQPHPTGDCHHEKHDHLDHEIDLEFLNRKSSPVQ